MGTATSVKKLHGMYKRAKVLHDDLYAAIIGINKSMRTDTVEDMVDLCLILRSTSELVDSSRKDCNGMKDLLTKVVCMKWANECLNMGAGKPKPIRGKLASGSPDVAQTASLPSKRNTPKDYELFMRSIGAWQAGNRDLVRPHWPGITVHITECLSAGKPLPPGIDPNKTFPVYKFNPLRKLVDLDSVEMEG